MDRSRCVSQCPLRVMEYVVWPIEVEWSGCQLDLAMLTCPNSFSDASLALAGSSYLATHSSLLENSLMLEFLLWYGSFRFTLAFLWNILCNIYNIMWASRKLFQRRLKKRRYNSLMILFCFWVCFFLLSASVGGKGRAMLQLRVLCGYVPSKRTVEETVLAIKVIWKH